MAVKIISDVHGEYRSLREQLEPSDTAILLGDYLNLIDFRGLGGILSEVYTREEVRRAFKLIHAEGSKAKGRRLTDFIPESANKAERLGELIEESYYEFFASLPCESVILYGNTDNPAMLKRLAGAKHQVIEAGVVTLGGERFGFVSGAPHGPWAAGLAGEMETSRYESLIDSLGEVDVLCSHYPPAVPGITWDVIARRDEVGSGKLVEYLDRYTPSYHYFGHVHNPMCESEVRGKTMLINAGFFRERKKVLVHDNFHPEARRNNAR